MFLLCRYVVVPLCWYVKAFVSDSESDHDSDDFDSGSESDEDEYVNRNHASFESTWYTSYSEHMKTQ